MTTPRIVVIPCSFRCLARVLSPVHTDAPLCYDKRKLRHTLKVKTLVQLQRWSEAVTACNAGNTCSSTCIMLALLSNSAKLHATNRTLLTALAQFPEDSTFIGAKKNSEVGARFDIYVCSAIE